MKMVLQSKRDRIDSLTTGVGVTGSFCREYLDWFSTLPKMQNILHKDYKNNWQ